MLGFILIRKTASEIVMISLRKHAYVPCCDFHKCKNDEFQMKNCDNFLSFALNIGAVLTRTHNLCFRGKARK